MNKGHTIRRFPKGLLILAMAVISCTTRDPRLQIVTSGDRATGIVITNFTGAPDEVVVRLATDSAPPIFGTSRVEGRRFEFTPVVPFTHGLTYLVEISGKEFSTFEIPAIAGTVRVDGIYPGGTVPENLLKIHILFSSPMREGQANEKVHLADQAGKELPQSFLYMKNELWDSTATMLTMWLDPGRIKRDLQPNQSMGSPLRQGQRYSIVIDSSWQDQQGRMLDHPYVHPIVVGSRDSLQPNPRKWTIKAPRMAHDTLVLDVNEPMDRVLLLACITVLTSNGERVDGHQLFSDTDDTFKFSSPTWKPGTYIIRVETRLEDLAGNNLKRPFDRDTRITQQPPKGDIVELHFEVHK